MLPVPAARGDLGWLWFPPSMRTHVPGSETATGITTPGNYRSHAMDFHTDTRRAATPSAF